MRVSTELYRSIPFLSVIILSVALFILFIPPRNGFIITGFSVLVSLLFYGIGRVWIKRKHAILISLLVFSLLQLKALQVFDTINAILLISLFVGLFILFK